MRISLLLATIVAPSAVFAQPTTQPYTPATPTTRPSAADMELIRALLASRASTRPAAGRYPTTDPTAAQMEMIRADQAAQMEAMRAARARAALRNAQITANGGIAASETVVAPRPRFDGQVGSVRGFLFGQGPAMLASHQYQEAADMAQTALLSVPFDTTTLQQALGIRIDALLGANQPDAALADAISLYNVCPLAATSNAIERICKCLEAKKWEPADVEKFRAEQAAQGGDAPPSSTEAKPMTARVFAAAKVDPAAYDQRFARYRREETYEIIKVDLNPGNLFQITEGRINLLLMANKLTDARALADRTLALATPREVSFAAQDLARVIRAQTRSVAAANQWLQRHPAGGGAAIPNVSR